jgi:hypothetical protein
VTPARKRTRKAPTPGHSVAAQGVLRGDLERIPANRVTRQPKATPQKTGLEVIREAGWKRDEDAPPEDRVTVVDNDTNETLYSGSESQFQRLLQAVRES